MGTKLFIGTGYVTSVEWNSQLWSYVVCPNGKGLVRGLQACPTFPHRALLGCDPQDIKCAQSGVCSGVCAYVWAAVEASEHTGRSIPEMHLTPASHFFWWRRRQARRRGSTHHAVDLSRGGDEKQGGTKTQPVKVTPGGSECGYTTTSGNGISETHLSPTP